jgi:hypothetical protein
MVEAAQNRSCHDPHLPRKIMAGDRRGGKSGRRRRQARPEGRVRTAPVIMEPPAEQRPPQMRLPERDQEIQALAPERSQESFTITIRIRRQLRRIVMLRRDASASPIRTIRSTSTSSI